ncbi:hypothetical protein [Bacillus sp. AK128]
MGDSPYKIIDKTENENATTIVYLCENDPVEHSLFQCSFINKEDYYEVKEHLHFCLKTEDFLDIKGLYSNDLEQSIIAKLNENAITLN